MTTLEPQQSWIAVRFAALTDYFMPQHMLGDQRVENQTKMFLVSHLIGPVLGLSVPLAFYFLDPTPGWDLLVLAASILSFWAFPFLLKAGVAYDRLVLMSIAVDWFVIFCSCYYYGGAASPTIVWFLIIPILAVFYIGGDKGQRDRRLILSCVACAIFAIAYFGLDPEPNDIPQPAMEVLGLMSAVAVMCYIAGMAVYYSRVFDAGVELETEVTRRRLLAVELRKAVDAATKAASAKSDFLARMSHELRSPLNAILGYGELLKEEDIDDPDSVLSKDIDRILDAGQYLTRLIDMILDLAKIESGKMKFNMQEHDIGAIVTRAVDRRQNEIDANGNTVHLDLSPDIGTGIVDGTRLEQIVDSIVINAASYTENGEIDVTLRREYVKGVPFFNLAIRDTGQGIAKDALPFIFESFVAQRDAAEGRFGGTGLALSVTSKLCEAMNGTISVESSVGKGSTFTVKLPLAPMESASDDAFQEAVDSNASAQPIPAAS